MQSKTNTDEFSFLIIFETVQGFKMGDATSNLLPFIPRIGETVRIIGKTQCVYLVKNVEQVIIEGSARDYVTEIHVILEFLKSL